MSRQSQIPEHFDCFKHPTFGMITWAGPDVKCPACQLEELKQTVREAVERINKLSDGKVTK